TLLGSPAPQMPVFENRIPAPLAAPSPPPVINGPSARSPYGGVMYAPQPLPVERTYDDTLCDVDGSGALGLLLLPCARAHERRSASGAGHDVPAWHSECASRANWNSHGRDRARNAGREPDHIRRGALDRRAMRWRFVGAGVGWRGRSDHGSVCRHGKLDTGTVQPPALSRRRDGRKRARRLCRVCDGICAPGLVNGSWFIRRPGWNSTRLDRTGKRRHQPAIRCAQPESIGTRYELADPPRYEPALQCAGAPCDVAEHCHMCDDPEWYPHDRGSADDVRSAFDRSSPEHGSDALPLTNPGARRPQGAYPMLAMIVV